jgi:hypothetical protein
MLYSEPFSAFSPSSVGKNWDGKKKQAAIGSECETIIQRGTGFRITKVENKSGELFVDMEVVEQETF